MDKANTFTKNYIYLLGITDFGNLDKSGGLFFSLAIDTNFKGDPSGVVGLVDGGSIVSDLLFTKRNFSCSEKMSLFLFFCYCKVLPSLVLKSRQKKS